MSGAKHWEQDKEATVYVGNLDERVTDSLVWELMLQAGRIVNVHLPKDRVTQIHQGYGFVEFISEEDAEYAARIMNQIRIYGKPIRVNKASADKQKTAEIGAELFVGNLDPIVSEQVLFETFSRFGALISAPKVARDDAGLSKGYGFVSFATFESSDDAINNLHGQYLMNKEVSVQYAYKKDGKGERHGDQAERMLAAQAREHNVQPPIQPGSSTGANANRLTMQPATFDQHDRMPALGSNVFPPNRATFSANNLTTGQGHHLGGQAQSLPPPPTGLPARPPPSQAGYGGPSPGYIQPGFPSSHDATSTPYPGAGKLPPGFSHSGYTGNYHVKR